MTLSKVSLTSLTPLCLLKIHQHIPAVAEHLAHGDFLGKCTTSCTPSVSSTTPVQINADQAFSVKIAPNPSLPGTPFSLIVTSKNDESIVVKVVDMLGKTVYQTKGSINQTYRFGAQFTSGVYIVQILHGTELSTYKIVKGN